MFLVSTCPYCQTEKIPFDIKASHYLDIYKNHARYVGYSRPSESYLYFNSFSVCRNCKKTVTFELYHLYEGIPDANYIPTLIKKLLETLDTPEDATISNKDFRVKSIVVPPPKSAFQCPEYVPEEIKEKFNEAARCHANDCIVASGIMLRLCLETATKNLLETKKEKEETLHEQIKNLFKQGKIKENIKDFADEIRLDGNYAVHEGKMNQENLQDLFEFTIALLEDIYSKKET